MKNANEIAMFGCPTSTLDADVRESARDPYPSANQLRAGASGYVLSLLSDAQELTAMGAADGRPEYAEDARQLMNRAKYVVDRYLS
jgi:hypothetical protein